jgi:protein SCO1/2
VRYLNGPEFLPIDLGMSILEASKGVVRPTIAKMLRFCMTYDSQKNQYGFDILRVAGLVTTFLVLVLAAVLVVADQRRKRRNARQALPTVPRTVDQDGDDAKKGNS